MHTARNSAKLMLNLFLSLESPKSVLDVWSSSDSICIFAKYGLGCICDRGIGAFLDCPKWRSASAFPPSALPPSAFSNSRFRRSSRFKWNEKINPPKIIQNTNVPPTQIVVMSCWEEVSSWRYLSWSLQPIRTEYSSHCPIKTQG